MAIRRISSTPPRCLPRVPSLAVAAVCFVPEKISGRHHRGGRRRVWHAVDSQRVVRVVRAAERLLEELGLDIRQQEGWDFLRDLSNNYSRRRDRGRPKGTKGKRYRWDKDASFTTENRLCPGSRQSRPAPACSLKISASRT
jgi:hypothetical protein